MAYVKTRPRSGGGVAYLVCWTDATGRECQRTYPGKAPANRALKERIAQEARDELADEAASRQRFALIASAWLEAVSLEVKPRTANGYGALLRSHVLPAFGDRRIGAITSVEVQQWVIDLVRQGLSHKTIRNVYTPLAATLQYAVDHKIIRTSPCTRLRLPKRTAEPDFEGHFLSSRQVQAVAEDVGRAHPMYGLIVRFVAAVGLRAGEVSGLQLRDVDLDRGVIHVRRTLTRDRQQGGWVVGTPKSKRSVREVPVLDEVLLGELADFVTGHPHSGDTQAQLFYSREHGGGHSFLPDKPFDPDNFGRRYLKPALKRAGLPYAARTGVRCHDLRHTCASLWFEAGIPLAVISRWLGHASVAVTDRVYVHLRPDGLLSVAGALPRRPDRGGRTARRTALAARRLTAFTGVCRGPRETPPVPVSSPGNLMRTELSQMIFGLSTGFLAGRWPHKPLTCTNT